MGEKNVQKKNTGYDFSPWVHIEGDRLLRRVAYRWSRSSGCRWQACTCSEPPPCRGHLSATTQLQCTKKPDLRKKTIFLNIWDFNCRVLRARCIVTMLSSVDSCSAYMCGPKGAGSWNQWGAGSTLLTCSMGLEWTSFLCDQGVYLR